MSAEPSIPTSLDRLRKTAEALNRESDALTESLRAVEQALKSMGLGIEAHLENPVIEEKFDGIAPPQWAHYFGYGKAVGKSHKEWGLFMSAPDQAATDRQDGAVYSIAEMSRELRALAAKHLPELLDLLAIEGEKVVKDIQDAKAAVQRATQKIK